MFIKNISGSEITLAGITFLIDEVLPISDIGSKNQISLAADEILLSIQNSEIELQYADQTIEVSQSKITSILSGNITEVTISNIESIINQDSNSSNVKGENFYYNSQVYNLSKGEVIDIEFKGYLKTYSIKVSEGTVNMQLINPKMNPIRVESFSTYDIDSDYRIKDAVFRIEATLVSDIEIYMDGEYYDSSGSKSKSQYLEEIYSSSSLPNPPIPEEKGIVFDINFLKADTMSETIRDSVFNAIGNTKGFINNGEWTRESVVDFKSILGASEDFPFTHFIWMKWDGTKTHSQYVMYKGGYYYYYINTNGSLYVNYDGVTTQITTMSADVWTMCIASYDGNGSSIVFYLNGAYSSKTNKQISFPNSSSNLLFGNLSYSSNRYGFCGELGRCGQLNYSVSAGMAKYMFNRDHPNRNSPINMKAGVSVSYFSIEKRGFSYPENTYECDIIEKEYANVDNTIFQEIMSGINYMDSTFPDILTEQYFMTIARGQFTTDEDGYYTYLIQGADTVELIIDDRVVCGNYGLNLLGDDPVEGNIYLEAGIHSMKFRHFQGTKDVSYSCKIKNTSINDFEFFNLLQPDTDDEATGGNPDLESIKASVKDWVISPSYSVDSYPAKEYTDSRGVKCLVMKDQDAIKLDIDESFLDPVFSFSIWIQMKEDKDCFIFSMGGVEDWTHWLSVRVKNEKIELVMCDESKSMSKKLEKYEWHKLDVNCDGTKLEAFLNGSKDNSIDIDYSDNEYHHGNNFWFNRASNGESLKWMESKFYMNDFKFRNSTKTKDSIAFDYLSESEKYDK